MSNSINTEYRRKLTIQTFKGRGRQPVPVNDCQRPSRGDGTKEDFAEFQGERLKLRRRRQMGRTPGFTPSPRKRSSLRDIVGKPPQYFEPLANGGYRTYHPTKGWRIVSPKRLRHFGSAR